MSHTQTFAALAARTSSTSLAELEALFDALPPVSIETMLGDWQGGVFVTGHAGEAQLPAMRWVGKRFASVDEVYPIVSRAADGSREINPVMGTARLRRMEFRGVVTATMCYDKHPICDHFRLVDADTVLGVMDRKGESMPLYFHLRRL